MRLVFITICLLLYNLTSAQSGDSSLVMTWEQYVQAVHTFHPLVRNSRLLAEEAEAKLLKARGGFDPKLEGKAERKSFDGKNYYTTVDGVLKFPATWGLEFKAGYSWNSGINLNPEATLPENGQAILGIDITLLQGLMLDQRRVDMQQARLIQNYNLAEQNRMINDLLFEAGKTYWEWALAQQGLLIRQEALRLSRIRLDNVREQFFQGDKPAIDTLEAAIQVQSWEIEYQQGLVEVRNARLNVSNFLWSENQEPIILLQAVRPVELTATVDPLLFSDASLLNLVNQHPEVRIYDIKDQQLQINRRWAKEQLKPRLDLGFNFLADGFDFVNRPSGHEDDSALRAILNENYKVYARITQPIFLRKARAEVDLANIKLLDNNNRRQQKRQEIYNKIRTYQNQLNILNEQINLQAQMATQYQRLLNAENEKFRIGESSIFLLNSREQKLIELRLKQIKLWAEYQKNKLGMDWAAGRLFQL